MTLSWNVQKALKTRVVKVHFITLLELRALLSAGFIVVIVR